MYFVLSGYIAGLVYLKQALAAILTFVGLKMLLIDVIHVHPLVSLGVIIGILTVAVFLSLRKAEQAGGIDAIAEAYAEKTKPSNDLDFERMLDEKNQETPKH
jgi:predicted tellurium resistance membrane protein TerC